LEKYNAIATADIKSVAARIPSESRPIE
jgi:hypothetical protein